MNSSEKKSFKMDLYLTVITPVFVSEGLIETWSES